jgi:hypothetical protein
MVEQYDVSSLEAVIILGVTISICGISGSMLGSGYLDRRMKKYNDSLNNNIITNENLESLRTYEATRITSFSFIVGTIAATIGFTVNIFAVFIVFLTVMDFFLLM